eukprot:629876-Alexandrium_andersonii.AAC.1
MQPPTAHSTPHPFQLGTATPPHGGVSPTAPFVASPGASPFLSMPPMASSVPGLAGSVAMGGIGIQMQAAHLVPPAG